MVKVVKFPPFFSHGFLLLGSHLEALLQLTIVAVDLPVLPSLKLAFSPLEKDIPSLETTHF